MTSSPSRVVFVFVDGIGIGPSGRVNPLSSSFWSGMLDLGGGQTWAEPFQSISSETHVARSVDATLGVEGLPQSGTGQATLFTGVNCAEVVGRHFGPFPHSATHEVLTQRNLFRQVESHCSPIDDQQFASTFTNAYPPPFFDWVERRGRWTVTTFSVVEAGLNVHGVEELRRGQALSADITGAGWPHDASTPSVVSEEEAASRLAEIARNHRVSVFEYFLTDKVGHGRHSKSPDAILSSLDRFFQGLMTSLDPDETCLVICSDHGNLEDIDTKTHTRNPVPLIAWGRGAHRFSRVHDLTGVTPAILSVVSGKPDG